MGEKNRRRRSPYEEEWWIEEDDREDFRRRERSAEEKVRAALDQIDWNMMDKHLHTPEARTAFHQICNDVRKSINTATGIPGWKLEDPFLFMYRDRIYTKPSDSMLLEWAYRNLPLKKGMLKIVGFGVPLVVTSFIAGEFVGAKKERDKLV